MLDNLPRVKKGKSQIESARWTLDQAIGLFLRLFPLGFEDPKYIGDPKHGERTYKWRAHERFIASLGEGERLLARGDTAECRKRAWRAIGAARNLLFTQECIAMHDGFKDACAATRFFRALFDVLARPKPEQHSFEKLIDAVEALPSEKGKANPAKWPVLTVFPFIAQPDTFMFLKPYVTQRAAEALAFPLQYRSALNWRTYESLLAMSDLLVAELLKRPETALHPRDGIDVQSFIWVTGRRTDSGAASNA